VEWGMEFESSTPTLLKPRGGMLIRYELFFKRKMEASALFIMTSVTISHPNPPTNQWKRTLFENPILIPIICQAKKVD